MTPAKRTALFIVLLLLLMYGYSDGYILERSSRGVIAKWDLTLETSNVSGGKVIFWLNADGSEDIPDGSDFIALRDAFNLWELLPSATIAFSEDGSSPTGNTGIGNDGVNLVVFVNSDPDLSGSGIVGLTTVFLDLSTGIISDADIRFNEEFDFSTDGVLDGILDFNGNGIVDAPGEREAAKEVDLLSVALHEVGHLLGLDHSPVSDVAGVFDKTISATMIPFVQGIEARSLENDDIAGASVLYPSSSFALNTGSISGFIALTNQGLSATFGGHATAIDTLTGIPIVGAISNRNGTYSIEGIPPGTYEVYVEPLSVGFTLVPFYDSVHRTFSPMLFEDIAVIDESSLAPGNAVFDSGAQINVIAGQDQSGIDFIGPLFGTNPGGGSSGGGGGCLTVNKSSSNSSRVVYTLILLTPLFIARMLRRNHASWNHEAWRR